MYYICLADCKASLSDCSQHYTKSKTLPCLASSSNTFLSSSSRFSIFTVCNQLSTVSVVSFSNTAPNALQFHKAFFNASSYRIESGQIIGFCTIKVSETKMHPNKTPPILYEHTSVLRANNVQVSSSARIHMVLSS